MRISIALLVPAIALLFGATDATAQASKATRGQKEKTTTGVENRKEPGKKHVESRGDEPDEIVGKTVEGKQVYAGSRGGHYYLGENGHRNYVKDFIGAKIVGKTRDGSPIYEGPRGGRYYYNSSGNRAYVPRDK
jgi:colicin import membrane protein